MSSDEDEVELRPWTFENAKSGRSKCKACSLQITHGEPRVGHRERHSRRGFDFYVWFHIGCCDIGYCETPDKCEFCHKKMKPSELTLTVESSFSDMVATVHVQCAALKAREETVNVDPADFALFDELSSEDQARAISLFDAENVGTRSDSDDGGQTVEVVGGTAAAAAVAGSTFLGYDLQQANDQFRNAEANGLIVDLGSSSGEDESETDLKLKSPGIESKTVADLKEDLIALVETAFGNGKIEAKKKKDTLSKIEKVLKFLQNATMTVDILRSTKIGIAVNKCKNMAKSSPELQAIMKKLVQSWKEIFLTSKCKSDAEQVTAIEVGDSNSQNQEEDSDDNEISIISSKKTKPRFVIEDDTDSEEEVIFVGSSQPVPSPPPTTTIVENVAQAPNPIPAVKTRRSSRQRVVPQAVSRPVIRKRKAVSPTRNKRKPRRVRKKRAPPRKKKRARRKSPVAKRIKNIIVTGAKRIPKKKPAPPNYPPPSKKAV